MTSAEVAVVRESSIRVDSYLCAIGWDVKRSSIKAVILISIYSLIPVIIISISVLFLTIFSLFVRSLCVTAGDRPFACDWPQCGMWFTQSSNLNKHYLTHTNERPFKCLWPNCDKRFKQSSNLNKHRLVHTGLQSIHFILTLYYINLLLINSLNHWLTIIIINSYFFHFLY